jgi:hypothetical protein
MCFGGSRQFLHLYKFTLLSKFVLNLGLLFTVVSNLFKVNRFADLFYLFEKLLLSNRFLIFLLFESFLKFDKPRFHIRSNPCNKLFVNLFELLFLVVPAFDRSFHPFLGLLASESSFHFLARLFKLRVDLFLFFCLLFD